MAVVEQIDYALDRVTPIRWLVTKIVEGGDNPPSLDQVVSQYQHSKGTGDLARVMEHEQAADEREANAFIARLALRLLGKQVEVTEDGKLRLTVPVEKVKYAGRKIHLLLPEPPSPWPGGREPFNPNSGIFADNIRIRANVLRGMEELRESMREFGWIKELPAIRDEFGVVLVGNRRLAVAKELGIEPVWAPTLVLGRGDDGDVYRFRLALASNLGFKPFTPEERKRVSEYLYGPPHEWSMERISKALDVGKSTIGRDLADFSHDGKNRRAKDGTRRGAPKKSPPSMPIPFSPRDPEDAEKEEKLVGLLAPHLFGSDAKPETKAKAAKEVGLGRGGRAQVQVAETLGHAEGYAKGYEEGFEAAWAIWEEWLASDPDLERSGPPRPGRVYSSE